MLLLLVLFFFFTIPFFVMVLIFMVFNTITRPRSKCNAKQSCMTEENVNEVNEPAQLYSLLILNGWGRLTLWILVRMQGSWLHSF